MEDSGKCSEQSWLAHLRAMWDSKRLSCAYTFKRQDIRRYDFYIIIKAHHMSCDAVIVEECEYKPISWEPVEIKISTTDNSTGMPHVKKTRLAGPRRAEVKDGLKDEKLKKKWRRDKALSTMPCPMMRTPLNLYSCTPWEPWTENHKILNMMEKAFGREHPLWNLWMS